MNRRVLDKYPIGSAGYILAHARVQRARGHNLSATCHLTRNPRDALKLAKQSIMAMLEQLERDIRVDCHRTETAFNRSDTKPVLVRLGPLIFPDLAVHIRRRFPNMATSTLSKAEVNWDMFGVWVWLITSIIKRHGLKLARPYQREVSFGEMDIQAWYDYCLKAH